MLHPNIDSSIFCQVQRDAVLNFSHLVLYINKKDVLPMVEGSSLSSSASLPLGVLQKDLTVYIELLLRNIERVQHMILKYMSFM